VLDKVFAGGNITVLENSLGAAALRQRVAANNIANVNTPGFKKSDVVFEDMLREAMTGNSASVQVRTHEKHLSKKKSFGEITPQIVTSTATAMRNDGNNVDVEAEMAQVAKTSLYYNALAQQLSSKFAALKTAMNQGGR
jgi:flagellar basal-body rod protein FlgB